MVRQICSHQVTKLPILAGDGCVGPGVPPASDEKFWPPRGSRGVRGLLLKGLLLFLVKFCQDKLDQANGGVRL